jgi:hypothetical protein
LVKKVPQKKEGEKMFILGLLIGIILGGAGMYIYVQTTGHLPGQK